VGPSGTGVEASGTGVEARNLSVRQAERYSRLFRSCRLPRLSSHSGCYYTRVQTQTGRVPAPITIGGREFRWAERTYVMGIVNVTPDSFSGDALGDDVDAAVRQALQMREDGADIIDVGGESTRPGFAEVPAAEEMRRVLPVIERVSRELDVPISIDTYKAEVAKAALEAGATLVNDVHGFLREPEIARVAAEASVPAIAMYNHRGREFHDTIGNAVDGLSQSLRVARDQGLPKDQVIVDPGFNFGWTDEQALEMVRRLGELRVLVRAILIGTSRKSTIGKVLGGLPVEDRLEGTAATVAIAIANGADIIRVHDVKQMARVARMADAVVRGWPPSAD
jgi:dihydropteroate synthase